MSEQLSLGLCGERSLNVSSDKTAAALGSGLLPVFATPALIALMEDAAASSVQPYLREGSSTVGTHLDIRHLAATPEGLTVRCETELIEIDRRRLVFACRAYDDRELIGEGTQERFIVDNARFMDKAVKKRG